MSDVVSTILIVLLAVSAVVVIAGVVLKNVSNTSSDIGGQQGCINLEMSALKCVYDSTLLDTNKNLNLTYTRGSLGAEQPLVNVTLIVESEDGSVKLYSYSGIDAFSSNFVQEKASGIPKKFSVAGVLKSGDGKKFTCAASSKISCSEI